MARNTDTKPPEEDEADDGVESAEETSGKRRFLSILLIAVTIQFGLGAWISIAQYEAIFDTAGRFAGLLSNGAADERAAIEFGHFFEFDNLVVNPAGSGGQRFLMISIGFESPSDRVIRELQDKEVVVRDIILSVLGRQTVADLSELERRQDTKEALISSVNDILGHGDVKRLYFTQYVLQ